MVTKTQKTETDTDQRPDERTGAPFSDTVKESASQIWRAGLGAFARAQEEGGRVFDALVKEGTSMQRKTQTAAGEKISEATSKMATMATDLSSRASGQWDKLENIFEERVSKALHKLGVPSAQDIDALNARIDELHRTVSRQNARPGVRRAAPRAADADDVLDPSEEPAIKQVAPRKPV